MSLLIFLNPLYCQQKIIQTPQRVAQAQTNWMLKELKFDKQLFPLIYNINLKYQVRSDSIRLSGSEYQKKRELYKHFSIKKREELREVLPTEIYKDYINLLDSIRALAPKQ